MSAKAIERAAGELTRRGEELRALPTREILKRLGDVLECFRDANSDARRALEAALPEATGFTPATLREGLDRGFGLWTGESLERLHYDEIGATRFNSSLRATGAEYTAVLLAGSIPMPSVLSILLPLAVGSPVLCKPASRDLATPSIVHDALRGVDPLLADCVAIAPFDAQDEEASRAFFSAPCVCATGSDETIAAVEGRLDAGQRRLLYRHRVSIAVVDLSGVTRDEVAHLALDVALWDQLGCLSPIVFYLVGGTTGDDEAFATALSNELARLEERLPRGEIDAAAAALITNERADAEMRAALDQRVVVHESEGTQWTVVLEQSAHVRPAPLHRFIRLVSLRDRGALREALANLVPHLAGVALAGFGESRAEVVDLALRHGASRVCRAGDLQAPPIDWKRDNQPLLLGLTTLANVETDT